MEKKLLKFTLNGEMVEVYVSPDETLLDIIRDKFQLTGTKKGCGQGECGACTVIMNGNAVNSCVVLAMHAMDSVVETIEGIGTSNNLHELQESFIKHGAIQCGFCTPGMIMSSKALLDKNPSPCKSHVKEAISGNICRCTGYVKIEEAVLSVCEKSRSEKLVVEGE
ncbi:(2Fe-2S)-binding protein [Anaeromicrobium sediminis]|uniref:Ferredoxin n=1 Tax=Anaeromicrobium sediminis TaxID=1478221 RepID=A0A267MM90_9FIRM|nr:(2Fe-2S)-binding protein [Anaeromicrobium sediminis]PAB59870.1 ferredoxin [Anaeromicrobium sediminis]